MSCNPLADIYSYSINSEVLDPQNHTFLVGKWQLGVASELADARFGLW